MQAERPEHAQYEAVDKGPEIAAGVYQTAHAEDQLLEMRPHHRHQGTDRHRRQRADDRHKARATKKTQERWQRYLVIAAMQIPGHQTDDHSAEHPGLQRLDPENRSLPHRARVLRGQRTVDFQQRIDGGVHYQIGDQRSQPRRALVAFGQPHRHADREQDRQVGEHDSTGTGHHGKYTLQPADIEEGIRLDGIGIGQRTADPQQQAGRRQHGDRQHERLAEQLGFFEPTAGARQFWC